MSDPITDPAFVPTASQAAETGGQAKAGPGERLRAARERQGRSQAEMAALLRMQPVVYAALEAEDYEQLGAPVYVKGHFRAAAKALDLPGEELAHACALQLAASEALATSPDSHPVAVAPAPLELSARAAAMFGVGAGLATLALLAWVYLSRPSPPEVSAPVTAAVEAGLDSVADNPITYRLDDDESAPELAQRGDDLDRLSVRFSGESWIQVKDVQQRLIYEGWHRRGDHPQINGRSPFNLVIGSVDAIEGMAMNDAPVALDGQSSGGADGSAVLIIGDPNASDLTLP